MDISYLKDRTKIPPYNRASFEGTSMFYGCTGLHDERQESLIVAAEEASSALGNPKYPHSEEYVMGGIWEVKKELTVVAIVHERTFFNERNRLSELHALYELGLKDSTSDIEGSRIFTNHLASEFAKDVPSESRHLYKISAAFSKHVTNLGFHGILYPSAKAKGDARPFNIALTPESVDEHLRLSSAHVYRIQRIAEDEYNFEEHLVDPKVNGPFQWEDPGFRPRLAVIQRWREQQRQP